MNEYYFQILVDSYFLLHKISASADRGPRSRVCARSFAHSPFDTSGNLSTQVSEKGGQQIWSIFSPFQAILSTFPTPILLFLWVKTPCKISELYDNLFWEKSNPPQRKRNNAVNTGHLVPWQRMQPFGPIIGHNRKFRFSIYIVYIYIYCLILCLEY
jgi:hypothetical protein